MPNGVPNSSLREYRFPIDWLESSTLFEIPWWRSCLATKRSVQLAGRGIQISRVTGSKPGLLERGTKRHFTGATRAGKERTLRFSVVDSGGIYRSLFIFSTLPENMLHQGVENSSNPK